MDKYTNAVLLDPEVTTSKEYYPVQCKTECATNNYYFGYGEAYIKACASNCDKKYTEYLEAYNTVKVELEQNITACMSSSPNQNSEDNILKACIFNFQKQALRTLGRSLEKLKSDSQVD